MLGLLSEMIFSDAAEAIDPPSLGRQDNEEQKS
jgi:hypothetical protein